MQEVDDEEADKMKAFLKNLNLEQSQNTAAMQDSVQDGEMLNRNSIIASDD